MDTYQAEKDHIRRYYAALESTPDANVEKVCCDYLSENCLWRGVHPFNEQVGAAAVAQAFWNPLRRAVSNLQRREDIFMAGTSEYGGRWVTSMGHFLGLFDRPWLGIPPTGKIVMIRYADFNRVEDGRIIEAGFFCDLVGVMKQAGCDPLPVQTGAELAVPGPRTNDGLLFDAQDPAESGKTLALVNRMTDELVGSYGTKVAPELLAQSWHDDMIWYGPSGIGSTYTISRYQAQHQYPFRDGLRDIRFNGHICRFAEGHYASWFGWPNLTMTPIGGFLGMPACDRRVDMRVVDIYRRRGDKLAENWVLIDIPYWLLQQGVDILERNAALRRW